LRLWNDAKKAGSEKNERNPKGGQQTSDESSISKQARATVEVAGLLSPWLKWQSNQDQQNEGANILLLLEPIKKFYDLHKAGELPYCRQNK